jgi:hypothetical protein
MSYDFETDDHVELPEFFAVAVVSRPLVERDPRKAGAASLMPSIEGSIAVTAYPCSLMIFANDPFQL